MPTPPATVVLDYSHARFAFALFGLGVDAGGVPTYAATLLDLTGPAPT